MQKKCSHRAWWCWWKEIIWIGGVEDKTVSVWWDFSVKPNPRGRYSQVLSKSCPNARLPLIYRPHHTAFAEIEDFALLYSLCCTILLFDISRRLLQCCIWLLSHVLLQQCSALEVFGDTCLFVALFVPHMWHHPLPALRQIKAFILRFVKSTNQCLFSPFVLICEWDIIPNFADMSGETRRGHLCRIETENYWKSENPDCGRKSLPMHDLLPSPKNALSRIVGWVSATCFSSECK